MSQLSPLHHTKRLPWIDAARGIALFGILMVNVPAFNAPFFLYRGEELYWTSGIDQVIQIIVDIFFQASFYTLFSFLFGYGMQMMKERLVMRDKHYTVVIIRRLLIMLGFGFIHAFFLWHGDILLSYAVIGFLLFFFYNRKPITMGVWFLLLLIVPGILLTKYLYSVKDYLDWINYQGINDSFARYKSDSISMVLQQNYADWIYSNGEDAYIYLTIALLPMFLAGMLFMKKKWLHDIEKHRKTLIIILFLSLVMFAIFKAGPYLLDNPLWLSFLQDHIGGAASSIFYVVLISILFQKNLLKKILSIFTFVGRMSLTNYISQSIICFILFYGPGFNLYGEVSPTWSVVIVIFIFTVQVIWSKWWLKFYHFGPLEWVWRTLTYGYKQPFRKEGKSDETERA